MTAEVHSAFGLLDERIQRWIWSEGWTDLRPFQEECIRQVLSCTDDILVAAPTAAGKTEAVVLPAVSLALKNFLDGVRILYIVPLKALANDLERRIDSLSAATGLPVHKWHGDESYAKKKAVRENPAGLLVITPESVQALLMRHPDAVRRMLRGTEVVIVDEVHAYLGTERGAQVQSLMARLDRLAGRAIRRVGLSATVGDLEATARFLRPGGEVTIIRGEPVRNVEVKLFTFDLGRDQHQAALDWVLSRSRSNTLVFSNTRAGVEIWTDALGLAGNRKVFAHHGNLSKDHRSRAEAALRDGEAGAGATVVATSTLELGIDIGEIDHVTQLGPPPSVAALHQRAGRGSRRSAKALTDIVLVERELSDQESIEVRIRPHLVQAIAATELMYENWCEPPTGAPLHLSTLVQQILAMVTERRGLFEDEIHPSLCSEGIFARTTPAILQSLVEDLLAADLLRRDPDVPGLVRLGDEGEKLTNHHKFYAAFATPREFRVVNTALEHLGSLPLRDEMKVGNPLLFAGQRWIIRDINRSSSMIVLEPRSGTEPPVFLGGGILTHTEVRRRMLEIYKSTNVPAFLDGTGARLLAEARRVFAAFELDRRHILADGKDTLIFPWVGTREMTGLAILLGSERLEASAGEVAIAVFETSPSETRRALERIVSSAVDTEEIAKTLPRQNFEKHHRYLREQLVGLDYLSQRVDLEGARQAAAEIVR